MKIPGFFFALLTTLFFVIALPLAIWTFSASQMILSADTYKNVLAANNLYFDLIPALLPALIEIEPPDTGEFDIHDQANRDIFLDVVGNMDEEDWASITADLIPADWLQAQTEGALDAFFGWLNDEAPSLDLQIDLRSFRERLAGESGQRVVNQIIDSWPGCTAQQVLILRGFSTGRITDPDQFPFCQPSGELIATTREILSSQLTRLARDLPDIWPDANTLNSRAYRVTTTELKRDIRIFRAMVFELILLPLALLSLTVFCTIRSLKSFGRWGGWPALLGGLLALIPVLLLLPLIAGSLVSGATFGGDGTIHFGPGSGGPLGDQSYLGLIFREIMRTIVGEFTVPVLVISAATIAIGLLLVAISVMARSHAEAFADEMTMATANFQLAMAATGSTPMTPTRPVWPVDEPGSFGNGGDEGPTLVE